MELLQKLDTDLGQAQRQKNELVVLTLRGLKAALKNAEISKREQLTEEEAIKTLRTELKKRREAVDQYEKGNRPELKEKEEKEIAIIETYLPAQMDEAKVREVVEGVIATVKPQGPQDMGKVMGAVMQKLGGQADGNLVNQVVREALK